MILGLSMVVIGNIILWQSEEETTQFFVGWLLGTVLLAIAGGLPRVPKTIFLCIATYFLIMNEQRTTLPKIKLNCVNGVQKVINGEDVCVCKPPYVGKMCDECAVGAIIENLGSKEPPICSTCKHQYIFPHCQHLQSGYKTETTCQDNWVSSCRNTILDLSANGKTYEGTVEGIRNELYNMNEHSCRTNGGTVYCDKCKDGHAGFHCCQDGFTGQNCSVPVLKCNELGDRNARLKNNEIPIDFGLVDPSICYTLGEDTCSCGGEFIGDMLCTSGMCSIEGKCTDISRIPSFDFRCDCEYGVGPNCETPPCYGGTRMYNGTAICRCDAKHVDSFNGTVFDACQIQNDGVCYPDLFGKNCEECQCAVNIDTYLDNGATSQCAKNRYGVFERNFATKELLDGCRESGICTNEPDDCGKVVNGTDRCLVFTNPKTFTAILFSGDKCLDTTDSKCAVWEPCQPR